jgi:hypothetical protein
MGGALPLLSLRVPGARLGKIFRALFLEQGNFPLLDAKMDRDAPKGKDSDQRVTVAPAGASSQAICLMT